MLLLNLDVGVKTTLLFHNHSLYTSDDYKDAFPVIPKVDEISKGLIFGIVTASQLYVKVT